MSPEDKLNEENKKEEQTEEASAPVEKEEQTEEASAPVEKEEQTEEASAPAEKEEQTEEASAPVEKEEQTEEASAPVEEEEEQTEEASAPVEEEEEQTEEASAPVEEELPKLSASEIDKMNVPKLKEAALSYGGRVTGVHGMDKTQLVRVLKEINDISLQENKRASNIDRPAIKEKIKTLKKERNQYLETKNSQQLKRTRNKIKALRRKLVRA